MEPASKPIDTKIQIRPLRRWRAARLIVAAVAVILGCMLAAQAFGLDIFGTIARWTEETFRVGSSAQTESTQNGAGPDGTSVEYASLQDALDAYGIKQPMAPHWYPVEFQAGTVEVNALPGFITIRVPYNSDEQFFAITIKQFATEEAAGGAFEKDGNNVALYEKGGVTHYIMSNNSQLQAAWSNGNSLGFIAGNLSQEDLTHMIDSIYEKEG